jgi:hypothetical protein
MAGAAVVLLAAVGGGAMMLRGGSSQPEIAASEATPDVTTVLGDPDQTAVDANAVASLAENAGGADASQQPSEGTAAADAIRREAARAAAAEARLAAIQKAQARAAQQAKSGAASAQKANGKSTVAAIQTNTVSSDSGSAGGGAVSKAKLSQFYSIVDDARSMAKRVMRSGNSQNAALARSYDANLKTLRDSGRGIQSEREADRLIAQAKQTRAYVQFLVKQSQ